MALNHGEDVIEIVRDPSGQLPDGFHLLRLSKLFFELFALRGVLGHTHEFRDRSVPAANWKTTVPNPADGTIRPHNAVLMFEVLALSFAQRVQYALLIVR